MKPLSLLLLLAISFAAEAQQLSTGTRRSALKYIFPLSEKDAGTLFKKGMHHLKESMLTTPSDSFPSDQNTLPDLLPGQYIIAYAEETSLVTELVQQSPLYPLFVQHGKKSVLLLADKNGASAEDATVLKNTRAISFNETLKGYPIGRTGRKEMLQVKYKQRAYFFEAGIAKRKKFRRPVVFNKIAQLFEKDWYYNYFEHQTRHEKRHSGYVLFSKPEYRPGDTLRLKAFITTKKGRPLNQPLLVRMTDRHFITDSILAVVKPYRKGAYTFEMPIPPADKLPFDLDEQYLITLEHSKRKKYDLDTYEGNLDEDDYARRRKVTLRGKFYLEEYTLNTFSFKARSAENAHYYKEPIAVFLKATDENDLPVQDGKAEITVSSQLSYAWHPDGVFVKDVLWKKTIPLETIGETKLTLPDSIFPPASFRYTVRCDFTSSDNESHTQTLYLEHKYVRDAVKFSMRSDSLLIAPDSSFDARMPVALYRYYQNKIQSAQTIQLPFSLKPDDLTDEYVVRHQSKEYRFKVVSIAPQTVFSRTADSVFALITLPGKHQFWYSIFRGKKLVEHGYGDSLWVARKEKSDILYSVQVQYLLQGKIQSRMFTIPLYKNNLVVKADHPEVAFPGQELRFTVSVTDVSGMPVPNADVTASSITSKFKNTPLFVPYFGKIFRFPSSPAATQLLTEEKHEKNDTIRWERWSREMKLDTIGYYNFLHSKTLWETAEPTPDFTTQFAPFVVENGKFIPIELIYIDEVPVYFSKAANLNGYSFPVTSGLHNLKIRTADKLIALYGITAKANHKTFIGINTATSDPRLIITKQKLTLSNIEKINLARYMIVLEQELSGSFAYVRTNNNLHLLNAGSQKPAFFLTGPLNGHFANLVVKGTIDQQFEPESGYRFQIRNGLVKQRKEGNQLLFSDKLKTLAARTNFGDFVMNEAMLEAKWKAYLDQKSSTTTYQPPRSMEHDGVGKLTVRLNAAQKGNAVQVKNILLFKEDDPSFIKIFPAWQYDFGLQDTGRYKIYYLFMNEAYILKGRIRVHAAGRSYYEVAADSIAPPDKESAELSAMLREKMKVPARFDSYYYDLTDVRDSVNNRVVDVSTFTMIVHGRVLEGKNLKPLSGATVVVKGTRHGTTTAEDGSFSLNVPENGVLRVAFVGYDIEEKRVRPGEYTFVLTPSFTSLDEVVVVGYGVQRKAAITGSVAVVTNQLSGRVAGVAVGGSESIRIRGNSTLNTEAKPLIIVDGIPYNGDLASLDSAYLKNMKVLKAAEATAIYGAAASNGVIILTSGNQGEDAATFEQTSEVAASLRKNFRDDAFWFPALKTDKEGKAFFTTVLPDDITSWNNRFAVFGGRKKTGSLETRLRSFKALSAQLSVPVFLVEGDSVQVIGKTMNYGHDTLHVRNTFFRNNLDTWHKERTITASVIDSLRFTVTEKDSVHLKYMLQRTNGYFDGEERKIPVFPQGVLETKGVFAALRKDTSFVVALNGPFVVHAESSALPAMLEEINYLKEYKYLCNEQLASKLKALLLEKEVRTLLKQDFKESGLVKNYIEKLNRSKARNGLWGWWSGNDDEPWISLHVVEALLMAEKSGFRTNINKELVKDYLVNRLEKQDFTALHRALRVLRKLEAKVDFEKYLSGDTVLTRMRSTNGVLNLHRMEAWQEAGRKINADSLLQTRSETAFGNYYWGKDTASLWWNDVQATLSAYRMLRNAGQPDSVLGRIRHFFLEKRRSGNWENTYESIEILSTILPDIMKLQEQYKDSHLRFSGGAVQEIRSFPFTDTIHASAPVTVEKKGAAPIYFTAYNKKWNSKPEAVSGLFTVTSAFSSTSGNGTVTTLVAGQKVQLTAKVVAHKDAEYVMIEVPIPAGCSYGYKAQGSGWQEVHREYFKEKVSIFCRQLTKGTHQFSVELIPRYNGKYNLNPAKAEMMYFPVFYGREQMKETVIK